MRRKNNYRQFGLKPLESEPRKQKIAVYDIEAAEWTKFLVLGFYDGKEYQEFYDITEFLDFLLVRKYAGYKVYAHNAGKYDLRFIFPYLADRDIEILDISGRLVEIKVKRDRDIIYFRDSYSLLPASLKKLGETFGYRKAEIDYNFDTVTPELLEYLKNDCMILYEILRRFQDIFNSLGGEIKLTLPASTLNLYRRKFFPRKLKMLPTYFHLESEIRKAYYGGRTEVFKRHGKGLYAYDFNSLYPSVMKDNIFPVGNPFQVTPYRYKKQDIGFAFIKTHIPENILPPLPYRSSMLYFPTGEIVGWYALPLLGLLEFLGIKFKTYNAILFNGREIFSDFVDTLYNLRMKNKENALEYIAKIAMNSLYGKFGQRIKRKVFIKNPTDVEGLYCYDPYLDLWYDEVENFAAYILPAISAYVTALAMVKLYKAIYSVGDQVFYCDTDSIYTTMKLETSAELGKLKLEYEIDEAIFLSQKLYALKLANGKTKITAKGFDSSKTNFTFTDFEAALYNQDYSAFDVEYETLWGFWESMKREGVPLVFDKKVKSIVNLETKRRFDGINTLPYNIVDIKP